MAVPDDTAQATHLGKVNLLEQRRGLDRQGAVSTAERGHTDGLRTAPASWRRTRRTTRVFILRGDVLFPGGAVQVCPGLRWKRHAAQERGNSRLITRLVPCST